MSSRFVRPSKFRHVYAEPAKPEATYSELDLSPVTGDHSYVKGNGKFFSVAVRGGGGPVMAIPYTMTGKLPRGYPTINGHSAAVYDTAWNPFNENMLATGSDDTTVKLWHVPDGGLTESLKEPVTTLSGHGKPVSLLQWHPTANGVLASAGKDPAVKVWDVATARAALTLEGFGGLVQDFCWSYDGALLATSAKDKLAKVHDPRAGASHVVAEWAPHEGGKAFKVLFLADRGQMLTVGFTKQSKREFKLWDVKALAAGKELAQQEVDQAAGVMMPFYDDDTRMLYLTGKGDGNIRFFEFTDEAPFVHFLSEHRTNVSTKGADFLPKRTCNALKCEIARVLKLTGDSVEPISFIVPRKSEAFQEDIFPDTLAGKPALEAEAWLGGANAAPLRISMDPSKGGAVAAGGAAAGAGGGYKAMAVPAQAPAPAPTPVATPAPVKAAEPTPAPVEAKAALVSTPSSTASEGSVSAAAASAAGANSAATAELEAKVEQLTEQLAAAQKRIAQLEASEAKLKQALALLSA